MKKLTLFGQSILLSFILSIPAFAQIDIGDYAPDFSFTDTDGESFTLSEQSGKVVFMFLFGNSCPSCLSIGNKTETDIYAVFKSNPDFVAVGLDMWNSSSSLTSVSSFRNKTGISYPLLIKAGSVGSSYGTSYDRLLVIDQSGILRHKGNTYASNDIENAKSVIQQYLTASGIDDQVSGLQKLNIYPNPASDKIVLSINQKQASSARLFIFNSIGKLLVRKDYNLEIGKNNLNLEISSLKNGIHFYHLESNDGINHSGKFLIKK